MKSHVLTPYVKVEALGWLFGFPRLWTLMPATYTRLRKRFHDAIAPPVNTRMVIDRDDEKNIGFTDEEQEATIESVLRPWGLPPINHLAWLPSSATSAARTTTHTNRPSTVALAGANPVRPMCACSQLWPTGRTSVSMRRSAASRLPRTRISSPLCTTRRLTR